MPADAKEGTRTCSALVKRRGAVLAWLADGEIFPDRSAVGRPGTRDERLAFVCEVWTGMTPLGPRTQAAAGRSARIRPRGAAPGRAGTDSFGAAGPHVSPSFFSL